MKVDRITTIASSNRQTSEAFEEMQNRQLLKLYEQFQQNPFDYAVINYKEGKEPKVKVHRIKSSSGNKLSLKNILSKVYNLIKRAK